MRILLAGREIFCVCDGVQNRLHSMFADPRYRRISTYRIAPRNHALADVGLFAQSSERVSIAPWMMGEQMDAAALEELISRTTWVSDLCPRLIEALMASRVAVPLDKGLENGALPPDFKPLTLNAQQGFPVLAVFTTPEKVTPRLKAQPAFQHSLIIAFTWAVSIIRPSFGIALDPDYRYSLVMSPAEVEALRART